VQASRSLWHTSTSLSVAPPKCPAISRITSSGRALRSDSNLAGGDDDVNWGSCESTLESSLELAVGGLQPSHRQLHNTPSEDPSSEHHWQSPVSGSAKPSQPPPRARSHLHMISVSQFSQRQLHCIVPAQSSSQSRQRPLGRVVKCRHDPASEVCAHAHG
jgi:hypothetical protein